MIATSSGVSIRPAALSSSADGDGERERDAKPSAASLSSRSAQPLEVDLEPGEEQQEGEPDQRDDLDRLVDLDPPSTDGPMTMPATISSTTDGSRTLREEAEHKGAAKATATTIRSPPNEGMKGGALRRDCYVEGRRSG